ncbi:MAG TPA: hypothetical protein VNZ53_11605 [Steroidobacteraceae bacterium]|nr:hypothetical protein [Steroidobacteraceae bacterium]
MRCGLIWLTLVDLKKAWLRSSLTTLAVALALIAVSFFVSQIGLRRAQLLGGYEESGAATLIVELNKMPATQTPDLAEALRGAPGVQSVEAPYNGTQLGLVADTSFVVFENEKQQESLGARTAVLGVDHAFDQMRDYYVNFHDFNPNAPPAVLGAPLLATSGTVHPPERNEIVIASGVADYVGVRPGAEATVDLIYLNANPPIARRLEGLRLIGTFELVGPDQGRFEPFWRMAARGSEVLTVRRPDAPEGVATTLPVLLNEESVREFLGYVGQELGTRGMAAQKPLAPSELVVRAKSIQAVQSMKADVASLLETRGLKQDCTVTTVVSFCLRLPERNNFEAALKEQKKLESGGSFFILLLLSLLGAGTAGLQVQFVVAHWREFGLLQAVGFSPDQILLWVALRVGAVLAAGITIAGAVVMALRFAQSASAFAFAAAIAVAAVILAALPVLLWPLSRRPAELLRVSG